MCDEDGKGQGPHGDGGDVRPTFAELLLSFPAEVGEIERDRTPVRALDVPLDEDDPAEGMAGTGDPA